MCELSRGHELRCILLGAFGRASDAIKSGGRKVALQRRWYIACFDLALVGKLLVVCNLQIWSKIVRSKSEGYLEALIAKYDLLVTEDRVCELRCKDL